MYLKNSTTKPPIVVAVVIFFVVEVEASVTVTLTPLVVFLSRTSLKNTVFVVTVAEILMPSSLRLLKALPRFVANSPSVVPSSIVTVAVVADVF